MKTDIAQTVRAATVGQVKDVGATLLQGIPAEMSFEVATDVLSRKTELIKLVRDFLLNPADLANPVKQWEKFYWKYLGISVNLSDVKIPERTEKQAREFTRLIIVADILTQTQVYWACRHQFSCRSYTSSLDASITVNERDRRNGCYAIWVRDTVEADQVHQNKSADIVLKEGFPTETLLERMIHELKYFAETGKHLDAGKITLCCGSRSLGGDVPNIGWSDGELRVGCCDPGAQHITGSSREVVY